MKIQAKCDTCGRTFLLKQIGPDSDAPGRCPFCGARFARQYSGLLVDAVQETEAAATRFLSSLGRLKSIDTGFEIDLEGFLQGVVEQIQGDQPTQAAG
jgi:DNA-directed RNA polymerase subunit RPC12/RpoP